MKTVVVTSKSGWSRSIAAAVVKSFMFDAGASGMCGLRSATTSPLSTSTTWMLASELRATDAVDQRSEPLLQRCRRLADVGRRRGHAARCGARTRLRAATSSSPRRRRSLEIVMRKRISAIATSARSVGTVIETRIPYYKFGAQPRCN